VKLGLGLRQNTGFQRGGEHPRTSHRGAVDVAPFDVRPYKEEDDKRRGWARWAAWSGLAPLLLSLFFCKLHLLFLQNIFRETRGDLERFVKRFNRHLKHDLVSQHKSKGLQII
jgi:hypothetical protein